MTLDSVPPLLSSLMFEAIADWVRKLFATCPGLSPRSCR